MRHQIIAQNFSKAAKSYDNYAIFQQHMAQKLVDNIHYPPSTILDIGCGTGYVSWLLRKKFPNCQNILIDISAEMLKYAQKNLDAQAYYICCSADDILQITDICKKHNVSLIVSNLCIQWIPNGLDIINTYQKLAPTFLTTLLKPSFHEWYQSIQIMRPKFVPPIHFFDHNDIQTQEDYKISYPSAREFLKAQNFLGTLTHHNPPLSITELRKACQIFEEKYNSTITYAPGMILNDPPSHA